MDNIFFLSCFLPLSLIVHWIIPTQKGKNAVLLVFSLLFYSFGGLTALAMLVAVALANYLLGMLIARGKCKKGALNEKVQRTLFI